LVAEVVSDFASDTSNNVAIGTDKGRFFLDCPNSYIYKIYIKPTDDYVDPDVKME